MIYTMMKILYCGLLALSIRGILSIHISSLFLSISSWGLLLIYLVLFVINLWILHPRKERWNEGKIFLFIRRTNVLYDLIIIYFLALSSFIIDNQRDYLLTLIFTILGFMYLAYFEYLKIKGKIYFFIIVKH